MKFYFVIGNITYKTVSFDNSFKIALNLLYLYESKQI